jgi:O-antigen ligase
LTSPDADVDSGRGVAAPAGLAGVVGGLTVAATFREGAFYSSDSSLVAVVALVIAVALVVTAKDRRVVAAVAAIGVLALWWLIRAGAQDRIGSFLPLGASMGGFACAFLAVRRLEGKYRVFATQMVVGIGAVSAAVGLMATTARWYPLSMPAQNLWRLAGTLTYSNAAGALLAMALLAGLGLEQRARMTRLMVCLCAAGLVATQSRGAVLAAIVGMFVVPVAQLRRVAVTVCLGVLAGLAVVATSSGGAGQPLAIAAVVVAVAVAVVLPRRTSPVDPGTKPAARSGLSARKRALLLAMVATAIILIAVGAGLVLRVPIERRTALGSSEDRRYEWVAAFDQWRSSPLVGVGPDQVLSFNAPDGDFAHFAHNEYLQILADGGLVGALLLVLCGACVARAVRRVDVATSCATGALLAFAVAGALDFDWHLAALGLVGGWVAGLAGPPRPHPARTSPTTSRSSSPSS